MELEEMITRGVARANRLLDGSSRGLGSFSMEWDMFGREQWINMGVGYSGSDTVDVIIGASNLEVNVPGEMAFILAARLEAIAAEIRRRANSATFVDKEEVSEGPDIDNAHAQGDEF